MSPLRLSRGDKVLLVCDQRYRHPRRGLLHEPLVATFRAETYPGALYPRIMDGLRSQGFQYGAIRLVEFGRPRPLARNHIERFFLRIDPIGGLYDRHGHRVWIERAATISWGAR